MILTFLIAGLFISYRYWQKQKEEKFIAELLANWGKPVGALRNMRLIKAYDSSAASDEILRSLEDDIDLENLFEFVDRTNSKPGQQYLYSKLLHAQTEPGKLLAFDALIDEVTADDTVKISTIKQLQKLKSPDAYFLQHLFNGTAIINYHPFLKLYIRFAGILWIGFFLISIILVHQYFFIASMVILLANFYLHFSNKSKISAYAHSLPQLITLINVAKKLLKRFSKQYVETVIKSIADLKPLKRKLLVVGFGNEVSRDPSDIIAAVWELIKILFLIEPRAFINAIDEVNRRKSDIKVVFEYVAEIDAAISVASLRDGLPYYCKPIFDKNSNDLIIRDLYHPLIEDFVSNSFSINSNKGVLITGSNMSGKTTFIRSVAINSLLAQTIYTSTSTYYSAPLLNICSSINIKDDVAQSKSYFRTEAISVHNIITKTNQTNGNCLIIIDEIFKGTNTIERVATAKAILSYLKGNNNFLFVSTHDIELAELLSGDYEMYSFEELSEDNSLIFDYKIKPGILKHRNAIAILKSMGYPEKVIADAKQVSEELSKKYR